MNSVLSAFKSSKSDGSIQSKKAKKQISTNGGSYANLRHIREIGSSTKMNSFDGSSNDEDDAKLNSRQNRCSSLLTEQYIPRSKPSLITKDSEKYEENDNSTLSNHTILTKRYWENSSHVKVNIENPLYKESLKQSSNTSSNEFDTTNQTAPTSRNAISNNCVQNECADARNISSSSLESNENHSNECAYIPVLSAASAKKPYRSSESITTTNRSMNNRLVNRLSLSSITTNPLPSVHGRSMNTQNVASELFCTGEIKRTRISTHQRNLSLDFRYGSHMSIIIWMFVYCLLNMGQNGCRPNVP